MKFRVLFSALALLALTSLGFGQYQVSFDYPGDWVCSDHLALAYPTSLAQSGQCFQGTPIPDGTNIKIMKNGSLFSTYPVNSWFVCDPLTPGGGYFSTAYYDFFPGTDTGIQVVVEYGTAADLIHAVYWTQVYVPTADNTYELTESSWSCSTRFTPAPTPQYDLGDIDFTPAPPNPTDCQNVGPAGVPYPTAACVGGNGPGHAVTHIAWLGSGISAEAAPNFPNADTFDDGVVFLGQGPWQACTMQSVQVTVSGNFTTPVYLSGWKDGNVDGDFDDVLCYAQAAPEWIIQDVAIAAPGVYIYTFRDPGCGTAQPYTGVYRFRLSAAPHGAHWWNGGCDDVLGEVEDYFVIPGDPGSQLPVELTAAPMVKSGDRELTLSFNVADETDVNTYEIWRDGSKVADITKTNGSYSYQDKNLVNDRLYNYTIVAVGLNDRKELGYDGKTVWAGSPSYLSATVTEYALHQNYPNPFNPTTEIVYDVVETGAVTLKVYNVMGQEVATLVNGTMEAGRHSATFDASGLTSGLYFYTISIGDKFSATRKMLLVQ